MLIINLSNKYHTNEKINLKLLNVIMKSYLGKSKYNIKIKLINCTKIMKTENRFSKLNN